MVATFLIQFLYTLSLSTVIVIDIKWSWEVPENAQKWSWKVMENHFQCSVHTVTEYDGFW